MPLTRKPKLEPAAPPKPELKRKLTPTLPKPAVAGISEKAEILETKLVSTRTLQTYYRNPRIGDIGLIAESLERNGQFKTIVVNRGTKTGRKNEVLGGNHTLLAARHLGWKEIWASFVDVDEDRARKIVLVDNASSDRGTYDMAELNKLLAEMPDVLGSGYNQAEVDALLATTNKLVNDSANLLDEYENKVTEDRNLADELRKKNTFDGALIGEEPEPDDEEEDAGVSSITETEDRLPGLQSLKTASEVTFNGVGPWDIPVLLNNMLVPWEDVPQNLIAWAGSATRDMDQSKVTFLYNWGVDSTSGMEDVSRCIPSFWCFDHYFAKFWCVDDRTEALTQRGWITGANLRKDDIVLSMDSADKVLKWSSIRTIFRKPYKGMMYSLQHRNVDALVTPGHKFPLTDGRLLPVEDLRQRFVLQTFGTAEQSDNNVYTDAFVELVGWAVTEGHYKLGTARTYPDHRPATMAVTIHQNRGLKLDRIRQCVKSTGSRWKEGVADDRWNDDNIGIRIMGEVAALIHEVSPGRVPTIEFMLALSDYQRELLIQTMIDGDGTSSPDRQRYYQKDRAQMDAFQMLCALAGYATTLTKSGPCWRTDLKRQKTAKVQSITRSEEYYDGMVWCPETEYGTFVVRRNDKVYVTGNTYPERYAGKFLNSGIDMMVSHDFTPGGQEDPRMEALYAIYKSRWLARYFQEAGIRVIPNITWRDGDEDFLRNTVLATLPVGIPTIAIQLQTLDEKEVSGGIKTYLKHIKLVFDTLKPEGAIIYVGKQVLGMIESGQLTFPCETIVVKARMFALGEQAKGRQRKSGI